MSKTMFWVLSWTWGFIMTFIGSLVFIALRITGHEAKRNQYGYYFEIGENWGGAEIGPFAIVNKNPSQSILNHEFGHSLQNCYLGPYMPFISLASAARYWWREYLIRVNVWYSITEPAAIKADENRQDFEMEFPVCFCILST